MQKNSLLLSLLGLLLLVGAAFWMQQKMKTSNTETVVITDNALEDSGDTKEQYPQHITAIPGTNNVWYAIPEIGVRFIISKEMGEDLIYFYEGKKSGSPMAETGKSVEYDVVGFSSKTLLLEVGESCSPQWGAIGSLTRLWEKPETSKSFSDLLGPKKGFKDFYIRYDGAQAVCARKDRLSDFERVDEKGRFRYSQYFRSKDFINSIELTK